MTPGGHYIQGSNSIPSEKSRSNRKVLHVLLVGISKEMTADIIQQEYLLECTYLYVYIKLLYYGRHTDTQKFNY